ncbi:hypothetical protein I1A46_18835 [Serratia liquefaciens]|uniref:hypothetical protein n=1 Tax=Serratia liquefaciens TaxID=614 RepID=UPI00157CCB95|nr:hypothetical protein [Serratia liquefaciens]MBF8107176.1 hypothetical protein [Serratia liquefaciens]
MGGAAVSDGIEENKKQSKSEFKNKFSKMKKSFTEQRFDKEREIFESRINKLKLRQKL